MVYLELVVRRGRRLTHRIRRRGLRRLGEAARAAHRPGRARARARRSSARRPVELTVAGRTDRGVHAWGQVASYDGEPVDALQPSTRCCPTTSRCSPPSPRPTASTRAATPRAAPTATACSRAATRSRLRARARAVVAAPLDLDALRRLRRGARRARTTSRPSRRRRPTTCASSATCSPRAGSQRRRRARVLDRGRHVHAPHEPRAGGHDARGRGRAPARSRTSPAARGPAAARRPGRPRRRTACTWRAWATASAVLALPS